MYTYMSICIYIKQKNTVCHIWFMCNTFSGCLKLVISSTLLGWGIAHVRCYWSCLPWTVAWSWWKDNVTSTFLTYCHISQRHRELQSAHTQVTLLTAHRLYQWPLPWGRQLAWLTASSTPTPLSAPLGLFSPTHQCRYNSTCLLCISFSSLHFFCWMVSFHSMACAFFLLFLQIWMLMPHWKTATINKATT